MSSMHLSTVGAIIVSSLCCIAFGAALVVAYMANDEANKSLLTGAVIASFSTTVSFWLGSSAGSQKKDEALINRTPLGHP